MKRRKLATVQRREAIKAKHLGWGDIFVPADWRRGRKRGKNNDNNKMKQIPETGEDSGSNAESRVTKYHSTVALLPLRPRSVEDHIERQRVDLACT